MLLRRGDAQIFYTELGSGPPVVLVHPFPSCHEFWLPLAELLSQRYRVILPDLRGMGQSAIGGSPITMQTHADDIIAVCREMGVDKAVFGGCSIGGYVLFELWRRHRDRMRALMLCNTKAAADSPEQAGYREKARKDIHDNGPAPFAAGMAGYCIGDSTKKNRPDLVVSAVRTMRFSTAEGLVASINCLASRPDSIPTLSTINVPTVILAGNDDVLSSREDSQKMEQGITGSRLFTIPQTGHYAPWERSEECGKILRNFL